jgi:branched-chain amino acid transport system ATP-binding protein
MSAVIDSSSAPMLALAGVGRRFGALTALDSVSMSLRQGERRAIIGTNGAGKTTLFNTISGDFPPTSGTIMLGGVDVTRLPPPERIRMGLRRTYQTPLLLNDLTVGENLYVAVRGIQPGRLRLWRDAHHAQDLEKVRELARRTRVDDLLDQRARELSHGQRRQVEIAMALAGTPHVLMLDEPAAGLSQGERVELAALLRDLPADLTIMLIEHDMELALGFAQMVTVLHYGKVICEGLPDVVAADQQVHDLYMGAARV